MDGIRHIGDVILIWALLRNVGTCSLDVKGEVEGGGPIQTRVLRQDTGTEQLVLVMKFAKADGAKGLHHLALVAGQPMQREDEQVMPLLAGTLLLDAWEEPMSKAKL